MTATYTATLSVRSQSYPATAEVSRSPPYSPKHRAPACPIRVVYRIRRESFRRQVRVGRCRANLIDFSSLWRIRGRRGQGPDSGRQGAALRSFRGRRTRSVALTRSSRSRWSRTNTPSGQGIPNPKCCRSVRNSGSASCRGARWGRDSSPARSMPRRLRQRRPPLRFPALHSGGPESRPAGGRPAQRCGRTEERHTAQIALAWLLAHKPWIVPIPGTRNLQHLDENRAAAEIQLTPDDLRNIESAYSRITVQGDRLSNEHMTLIDQ